MPQAEAPPGDQYWLLIEPHWVPLNETWSRGVDQFLAASQQVSAKVLNLYAAHWCRSEIDNGGFHQFFFNTTGLLAPEAVEGFRAIGMRDWAGLLSEAMLYFGTPYPRERTVRLSRLPSAGGRKRNEWDPFAALDEGFYGSSDAELYRWEIAADAYARSAA